MPDRSPPPTFSPLARSLEFWREQRGMSQAQLSQKAGLAVSAVNDILRNPERSPRLTTIEQLAKALDITLWQLIGPPGNQDETAGIPTPSIGFAMIGPDDFAEAERLFVDELAREFGFDPADAKVAIVLGIEAIGFGLTPGARVALAPAADYAGQIVAVTSAPGRYGFRYCAPPWLIGFSAFGNPFHEFQQAPGLTILGVVFPRHLVETRLGRAFPRPAESQERSHEK